MLILTNVKGYEEVMKISGLNLDCYNEQFRVHTESGSIPKEYYTTSLLVLKYFLITFLYTYDIKHHLNNF